MIAHGLKIPAAKRALGTVLDGLPTVAIVVRGAERELPDTTATAYLYRTEAITPRRSRGTLAQTLFDLQVTFEASEPQPRRPASASTERALLDQVETRCWQMVTELAEALGRDQYLDGTVSSAELQVTTEESGAVNDRTTCRIYTAVSCTTTSS